MWFKSLKVLENLLGRAQVAQGQPSSSGGMRCMDELVFYSIGILGIQNILCLEIFFINFVLSSNNNQSAIHAMHIMPLFRCFKHMLLM